MSPDSAWAIRVCPASAAEMAVVAQLFQFYRYDISESRGAAGHDVLAEGRYALPPYLDSFPSDSRCFPFLVRADDHLAGFALVRAYSQLTGDPAVHDLLDFCILRKYRGRGVGTTVACALFDRFPGRWEVRQYVTNRAAQRFWRRVVDRYTGGRYTELAWDDARHRGVVQRFDTTTLPPRTGVGADGGDGEGARGGRR